MATWWTEPIDMAALEQVTVQQGPKEAKLLTDLKAMDADGDGKLTFDEMGECALCLRLASPPYPAASPLRRHSVTPPRAGTSPPSAPP